MVSSKEVINYLKKNIDKKNIVSMFVAGSVPTELIPQSDLDIFIVFKNKYRNDFFGNLTHIMDNFVKNKKNLIYSFYRGPVKYKNKGLIHFIIYTDIKTPEGASFEEELLQMLKYFNVSGNVRIIFGKNTTQLTKNVNWNDRVRMKIDIERVSKPYSKLLSKECVVYSQWKIIKGRWLYTKIWKKPSKFLAEYLCGYYKKNLTSKN